MPGLWRTPLTWAIGMVTDTMMNQHVRDQLSALKNDHMLCCGRITLTTGVPVTTADVTGASTVYFTPFRGNLIALHDGDHWQVLSFAELSLALGADATNTNYDLFAYYSSGAAVLERTAWTNATTRATALVSLDGVLVKSSDTTRRYLGTYRTSASGQTEDSVVKRFVWNYYNRVRRSLVVYENTDTWTYTTATFRQANNSAVNQVAVVVGVAEVVISLRAGHSAQNSTGAAVLTTSIGEDSTTTPASYTLMHFTAGAANLTASMTATLDKYPPIGYHFYAWLELSTAIGTTTWFGDNGIAGVLNGISGWYEG